MVAIHNDVQNNKGMVWSIDIEHKCLIGQTLQESQHVLVSHLLMVNTSLFVTYNMIGQCFGVELKM